MRLDAEWVTVRVRDLAPFASILAIGFVGEWMDLVTWQQAYYYGTLLALLTTTKNEAQLRAIKKKMEGHHGRQEK